MVSSMKTPLAAVVLAISGLVAGCSFPGSDLFIVRLPKSPACASAGDMETTCSREQGVPYEDVTFTQAPPEVRVVVDEMDHQPLTKLLQVGIYTYAVMSAGEQPTEGYQIEIKEIKSNPDQTINITYEVLEPQPADTVALVHSHPYRIIRFANARKLSVAFQNPAGEPEQLRHHAATYLEQRQWQKAEEAARQATDANPRHATGWLYLGQSLLEQAGQEKPALESLRRASQLSRGHDPDVQYYLIKSLRRTGQENEAKATLALAKVLFPQHEGIKALTP